MRAIYKITCVPTAEFYIGGTIHLKTRWTEHRRDLNKRRHFSRLMQDAWNARGEHAFKLEILEVIPVGTPVVDREVFYLKSLRPTFNLNMNGQGGPIRLGQRHSDEAKQKIADSHQGIKATPEARAKMSAAKLGKTPWNKGKKCGPSWCKGLKFSAEHRAKLSAARTGRKLTPEHRANIACGLDRAWKDGRH